MTHAQPSLIRPYPAALQFMVSEGALDLHEGVHKAGLLGFCDPCPGKAE